MTRDTTTHSSVWTVAEQTARAQRSGRYLPETTAHPGKMLPALAREAISLYSRPGEFVCDPMCGIGTSLVEAIHLGRHAIGVELEPRWSTVAAANLDHAQTQGATGHGQVAQGDARHLGQGLLDAYSGQVALILTSPPYGPSLHGHIRKTPGKVMKYNARYSRNPDNLAQLPRARDKAGRPSFQTALAEILAGCRRMLTPDGRLVMTLRPYRQAGRLIDLPGELEQLAAQNGLRLDQRRVALLCDLRGGQLIPRASFFQLAHQRSGRFPRMLLIAHEDVLVFAPAQLESLNARDSNVRDQGTKSATVRSPLRGESR